MKKLVAIPIITGALLLSGCGIDTENDQIALWYGGGVTEEKKFKGCVPPGTTAGGPNFMSGDATFKIPYGNRDYSFGTGNQQERDAITVSAVPRDITGKSLGPVDMTLRGTLSLELTKDCKKLDSLWRNVGQRFKIDTPEGWLSFLNLYVGGPAEKALDLSAQGFTPEALANDPETYAKLVTAVGKNVPVEVNRLLGDNYFTGPNGAAEFAVVLQKPEPPKKLKDEYLNAEAARQGLQTAKDTNAKKALEAQGIISEQKAYGNNYVAIRLLDLCREQPDVCKGWLVPPGSNLGSGQVLVQR